MKLGTHRLVNLALAFTIYPLLQIGWVTVGLMAGAAILADTLIDSLGHKYSGRSPIPRRSWRTHQPLTAALTGGVGGAAIAYAATCLVNMFGLPTPTTWPPLTIMAGIFASQIHLLLDLPTGSGIYLTRTRRLAAGHLSWDNGAANLGLSILSLLVIVNTFLPAIRLLMQSFTVPFGAQ